MRDSQSALSLASPTDSDFTQKWSTGCYPAHMFGQEKRFLLALIQQMKSQVPQRAFLSAECSWPAWVWINPFRFRIITLDIFRFLFSWLQAGIDGTDTFCIGAALDGGGGCDGGGGGNVVIWQCGNVAKGFVFPHPRRIYIYIHIYIYTYIYIYIYIYIYK